MRGVLVLALIAAFAQLAAADPPGLTEARQPPPTVAPLTDEEEALIDEGYIDGGTRAGGIVLGTVLGFGLGHIAERRWHERGWIFTAAETLTIGVMIGGVISQGNCHRDNTCPTGPDGTILLALFAYTGFHIWEIVDAAAGPSKHNRRIRELRIRAGLPVDDEARLTPLIVPAPRGDGAMAGVALTF